MRTAKNILACLLAAYLVCGACASCGNTANDPSNDAKSTDTENTESTATETETTVADTVTASYTGHDYAGYTYRILSYSPGNFFYFKINNISII